MAAGRASATSGRHCAKAVDPQWFRHTHSQRTNTAAKDNELVQLDDTATARVRTVAPLHNAIIDGTSQDSRDNSNVQQHLGQSGRHCAACRLYRKQQHPLVCWQERTLLRPSDLR